jgi:hypothetical protein
MGVRKMESGSENRANRLSFFPTRDHPWHPWLTLFPYKSVANSVVHSDATALATDYGPLTTDPPQWFIFVVSGPPVSPRIFLDQAH